VAVLGDCAATLIIVAAMKANTAISSIGKRNRFLAFTVIIRFFE